MESERGRERVMDRYLVPVTPTSGNPKPDRRFRWKRSLTELDGKFEPKYRHDISALLMQSYSEIGVFPHSYHVNGVPCPTHLFWFSDGRSFANSNPTTKRGISALEFDAKGVYLASVTKSGCLTVHDFETLYCQGLNEDESKQLLHISKSQQLDIIRWNLANQDEVACTSMRSSEVHIFDIGYISSEPVEILRKRPTISVHGCHVHKGLSDIAFSANDHSRLLASDTNGVINIWDRRASDLPCFELTSSSNSILNSIKFNQENQIVFGASKNGNIYIWDLRGGRSSAAFQNNKEVYYFPLTSLKLASELEKIGSLRAQSNIVSKEIHSIDLDPSCAYQLAFHLDDGWSGVLNIHNMQVTHIHCPPPPWLDDTNDLPNLSHLRRPSWLPTLSEKWEKYWECKPFKYFKLDHYGQHAFRTPVDHCTIYAVGSSSSNGLYLLDFYPDSSSPCHVGYNEDIQHIPGVNSQRKQNRFVPLSEGVTACTTHPLNGTIVAGTMQSSLLVISQDYKSYSDIDGGLENGVKRVKQDA